MARTILGIFEASADGDAALRAREIPRLRLALPLRGGKKRAQVSAREDSAGGLIRWAWLLQALRSGIVAEQIFENG